MKPLLLTTLLTKKNIVVLGAGITGMSCVRFLHDHNISFAVNDSRHSLTSHANNGSLNEQEFHRTYPDINLVLGYWDQQLIAGAELILVSPGIDLDVENITEYINPTCTVFGDVELFCLLNNQQEKPIPVLAVTGSNGKSTVVSLVEYLGKSLGKNAQLAGNIGVPILNCLMPDLKPELKPEVLVLELSSFQLETLSSMKAIAATVLNISDDHLDRHKNLANYQAIKQKVYQQCAVAIVNRDDELSQVNQKITNNLEIISFGSDQPKDCHFGLANLLNQTQLMFGPRQLIALENLPLAGQHNALNYLAALALGYCAGWPIDEMVAVLPGFKGLAHRCQRIESHDGLHWINDSKATNVGASLAAINGLSMSLPTNGQIILIAGGDGKGADFSPLVTAIEKQVNCLITLGIDGYKIQGMVKASEQIEKHAALTMKEAVITASKFAKKGDVILLSPACSSLDMFQNFAERGQVFENAVAELTGASSC